MRNLGTYSSLNGLSLRRAGSGQAEPIMVEQRTPSWTLDGVRDAVRRAVWAQARARLLRGMTAPGEAQTGAAGEPLLRTRLALVTASAEFLEAATAELDRQVAAAVSGGATYGDIGRALGISRQAARKRWAAKRAILVEQERAEEQVERMLELAAAAFFMTRHRRDRWREGTGASLRRLGEAVDARRFGILPADPAQRRRLLLDLSLIVDQLRSCSAATDLVRRFDRLMASRAGRQVTTPRLPGVMTAGPSSPASATRRGSSSRNSGVPRHSSTTGPAGSP